MPIPRCSRWRVVQDYQGEGRMTIDLTSLRYKDRVPTWITGNDAPAEPSTVTECVSIRHFPVRSTEDKTEPETMGTEQLQTMFGAVQPACSAPWIEGTRRSVISSALALKLIF
jgi:hypothetical protein